MKFVIVMLIAVFSTIDLYGQILLTDTAINVTDVNGLRQGVWRKKYPNGNPAYEAFFKNNKPTGNLKRYFDEGGIAAHLLYGDLSTYATAKIYNKAGTVIAFGYYLENKKDSLWFYYSDNSKIVENEAIINNKNVKIRGKVHYKIGEERYKNGVLHGISRDFYPSGKILEERQFNNGVEEGVCRKYFPNGRKQVVVNIKNDKMHGNSLSFFKSGRIETMGQYSNGLKNGKWTIYEEDGTVKQIITYKNGVAANQNEIDSMHNFQLEEMIQQGANERENLRQFLQQFGLNPEQYVPKK